MMEYKYCLYRMDFPSGKSYLGITARGVKRRGNLHRSHAKKGRAGAVYAAIRKYGMPPLQVLVVAPNWEYLTELERKGISAFNTKAPNGYNLTDGGEGAVGGKWTEAHYAAAAKRRGIPTGRPNRGWKHTDEAKKKISEAGKGRVFSPERRAKIGASKIGNKNGFGKKMSPELKACLVKISTGRVVSDETRARMSLAAKARQARVREKRANTFT